MSKAIEETLKLFARVTAVSMDESIHDYSRNVLPSMLAEMELAGTVDRPSYNTGCLHGMMMARACMASLARIAIPREGLPKDEKAICDMFEGMVAEVFAEEQPTASADPQAN